VSDPSAKNSADPAELDVVVGGISYRFRADEPLLKGLQALAPAAFLGLNFCWNGDCGTCAVEARSTAEGPRRLLACQTYPRAGLILTAPPAGVVLPAEPCGLFLPSPASERPG
jgi:hypothetical protein